MKKGQKERKGGSPNSQRKQQYPDDWVPIQVPTNLERCSSNGSNPTTQASVFAFNAVS